MEKILASRGRTYFWAGQRIWSGVQEPWLPPVCAQKFCAWWYLCMVVTLGRENRGKLGRQVFINWAWNFLRTALWHESGSVIIIWGIDLEVGQCCGKLVSTLSDWAGWWRCGVWHTHLTCLCQKISILSVCEDWYLMSNFRNMPIMSKNSSRLSCALLYLSVLLPLKYTNSHQLTSPQAFLCLLPVFILQ